MRKQFYIWIMIVFLLPALACSLGGSNEGGDAALDADLSAPSAPQTPAEESVVEDVDTAGEEKVEAVEEAAEAESAEFAGVADLDALSAYRVKFIMDFDGESGGQPSKGHIEMTLEQTKDPPARHLQMSMEGTTVEQTGGFNALDLYSMGDTVYLKNEAMGDSWISFSGGEAESFEQGFFAPDEQLELPEKAKCGSQSETINGVSAIHCTFTQEDVKSDEATYESLQGDVWITTEGNHIVKYKLVADGYRSVTEGEEGIFDFGSVSFEYNLTDMNGDFTITLPEEAKNAGGVGGAATGGAATGDLPVLDDAAEVMSMAGFVSYYTASDIQTVVEYYRQELPALGWQENAQQGYADETSALLGFTKESKTLMVTVTIEDGRTSVIVTTIDQ
ncbi:MAG: hypothetical protein JXM69_19815 [Anaerolineae bacterium]|nr:hypothetical protein [Anaerolineae bacterium]